jgi:hypothetical protein
MEFENMWQLGVVLVVRGLHLVIQGMWRVQHQEARRECKQRASSLRRAIWRIQGVTRHTSLCLRVHHLVVSCAKWNCPLACHPPI